MIWYQQIQAHQPEQRSDQPFGLAQRLVKHCPEDQRCLDCEVRVARLTARRGPGCRPPSFNGIVTEPDCQRASLSQPGLVVSPVRHLVAGFRNPMAALGIVFVRHGQAERSGRGAPSIQCQPPGQPPHPCTKPPKCAKTTTLDVSWMCRVRWTPLVRQLGWRVKRESRGIIAPCRCWGSVSARAAG